MAVAPEREHTRSRGLGVGAREGHSVAPPGGIRADLTGENETNPKLMRNCSHSFSAEMIHGLWYLK